MRSKGTETGDTLEGDPPEDEGGVSSSVPSGGVSRWAPAQPPPQPPASDMLYVNLEEAYPPSPPFLERDPNMSSAARYSPLHGAPAVPYVAGPHSLARALPGLSYPGQYVPAYPGHVPGAPLLHSMEDVTCSDETVQHDTNPGFYSQQVYSTGDGYGVSSSSAVYMPPTTVAGASMVPPSSHLLDTTTDLQLVMSSDGEYHMIDGSGMKTEHVELLITGGQSGISYSLSSENGFLVARPTVSSCDSHKQPGNVVLESGTMNVDVSVLDTLDEGTQFDGDQSIVLEADNLSGNNLHLDIGNSDDLVSIDVLTQSEGVSSDYSTEMEAFDIVEYLDDDSSSSQAPRRGRKLPLDSDMSITCILDKSVPCRAEASLPEAHLLLGAGGVFTRRRIPSRARFGPLEGLRRRLGSKPADPAFLLHTTSGDFIVDVSDEKTSNWMRYVRFAPGPSQNVCLHQCGEALYFTTTQAIAPRCELLLGYSPAYARRWDLPVHTIAEDAERGLEWPCYECPMRFASSPELQAHLNMHDEEETKPLLNRKTKKKTNSSKLHPTTEHRCNVCDRVFPRGFSLKRHMQTHKRGADSTEPSEEEHISREVCDANTQCSQSQVAVAAERAAQGHQLSSCSIKQESLNVKIEDSHNAESQSTIKDEPALEQDLWTAGSHTDGETSTSDTNESLSYGPSATSTEEPSELQNEVMEQQEEISTEDAPSVGEQTRSCDICQESFPTEALLETHKGDHQNKLKAVPCPECPRRNKSSRLLSCPLCSHTSFRPQGLREHLREHQRPDGSFQCPICHKMFIDYNCVRKHIRTFHARRYACLECGTSYCSSDKLRLHMLKHSDHREFLCPDCGKQFKRKDKLADHIRRQHHSGKANANVIMQKCLKQRSSAHSFPADPNAYLRFTFKCLPCRLGFKRRGMLVNHLARRHPEVSRAAVPELQLPILRTARDYFCQHCDKVYKSSSKRKAHILKNHPGESVPPSSRGPPGAVPGVTGYSACVGAVPSSPHHCPHNPCHKQYASKAKLLQHIRHKHTLQMGETADSKENSLHSPDVPNILQSLNCKGNYFNSDDSLHEHDDKMPALIYSDKLPKLTKFSNPCSKPSDISSSILKTKLTSIPPPLQLMGTCNKWGDNKILTSLLSGNPQSFSNPRLGTTLENGTLRKSSDIIQVDSTKPLTEMKLGSYLSNSPKQSSTAPRGGWRNGEDPSVFLESLRTGGTCLRLIQVSDGLQILEDNSIQGNPLKNIHEGSLVIGDMPKLHISGHIFSVEGNKLPPVSVLASKAGTLAPRYTDR